MAEVAPRLSGGMQCLVWHSFSPASGRPLLACALLFFRRRSLEFQHGLRCQVRHPFARARGERDLLNTFPVVIYVVHGDFTVTYRHIDAVAESSRRRLFAAGLRSMWVMGDGVLINSFMK